MINRWSCDQVAMISPLNVKRLLATNMELRAMVPVGEWVEGAD